MNECRNKNSPLAHMKMQLLFILIICLAKEGHALEQSDEDFRNEVQEGVEQVDPDSCPNNAVKNVIGKCYCKEHMVTFSYNGNLHCEPCLDCLQCQGTRYLCENYGHPYNYTTKPKCSDPPQGYFTKHNTFEKCQKPCNKSRNEYESYACAGCRNRICSCMKGHYRDSAEYCTKRCSKCSIKNPTRKPECSDMEDPEMRCIEPSNSRKVTFTTTQEVDEQSIITTKRLFSPSTRQTPDKPGRTPKITPNPSATLDWKTKALISLIFVFALFGCFFFRRKLVKIIKCIIRRPSTSQESHTYRPNEEVQTFIDDPSEQVQTFIDDHPDYMGKPISDWKKDEKDMFKQIYDRLKENQQNHPFCKMAFGLEIYNRREIYFSSGDSVLGNLKDDKPDYTLRSFLENVSMIDTGAAEGIKKHLFHNYTSNKSQSYA